MSDLDQFAKDDMKHEMCDGKYLCAECAREVFKDLDRVAREIWNTYDNEFGYVDGKIHALDGLKPDDMGVIVGMFDVKNQRKLYDRVGWKSKRFIDEWVGGLENREKEWGLI